MVFLVVRTYPASIPPIPDAIAGNVLKIPSGSQVPSHIDPGINMLSIYAARFLPGSRTPVPIPGTGMNCIHK